MLLLYMHTNIYIGGRGRAGAGRREKTGYSHTSLWLYLHVYHVCCAHL